MARGKLIVFEGLDRAGKSTQCARLASALRDDGVKVRHLRFPDRTTPIGRMINEYLSGQTESEDHVIHLLFSANRWEAAASIREDIAAGVTVVVDRYYYSGCVYSAAKANPELSLEWARHPDVGLPRPDLCLFLDISAEEAAKRGGYGTEKYEKKEMQDRVRELFDQLIRGKDGEDFVRVDGGKSLDEVHQALLEQARKILDVDTPLRFVEPW
ncbi:thymidylate kinase [Corynespora cassiicola Philippines]|uniref:Thymidylate kinase n=1 Tax=Corynespora cassiicola Philippines TaxID=1448308 RepID=A0A2T2PDI6_CORCC|nr:thymidylate kinase [Corynespora cassiicola Philippines]